MYFNRINKTITAMATAPGSSIGIIRISGKKSLEIAKKMTKKKVIKPFKTYITSIFSSNQVLDKALVLFFKSPKSFTGEDVVEFHLHGTSLNAKRVLEEIIKNGANQAINGEFSFRAVMNNKMNLSEAVSLSGLIVSSNETMLELSRKEAFENRFHKKITVFYEKWSKFNVLATSILDFPEHIDDFLPTKEISLNLEELQVFVQKTLENSNKLSNFSNTTIVLAGKPNVGKSTLFNQIIKTDRAIVSDEEGTTRDYISHKVMIGSMPVEIIDTAGIRKSDSKIENEGVLKSLNLIENKDFVVFVLDSSKEISSEEKEFINKLNPKKSVVVLNKIDKNKELSDFDAKFIQISAKNDLGIEELTKIIQQKISAMAPDTNTPAVFEEWQRNLLFSMNENIEDLKDYLKTDNIEIISHLIKTIYNLLTTFIGKEIDTKVYEKIFSNFCIGK